MSPKGLACVLLNTYLKPLHGTFLTQCRDQWTKLQGSHSNEFAVEPSFGHKRYLPLCWYANRNDPLTLQISADATPGQAIPSARK